MSARRASPSPACASSVEGRVFQRERRRSQAALPVCERIAQQRLQLLGGQRLEHVNARSRQQCADDLERRILGGGADEGQRAVLDVRQKRVLLRLVEAVHLVEKQHRGGAARGGLTRLLDRLADFLDAGLHRRQCDEAARCERCAIRRASVVLPVPGGPQRIIECG